MSEREPQIGEPVSPLDLMVECIPAISIIRASYVHRHEDARESPGDRSILAGILLSRRIRADYEGRGGGDTQRKGESAAIGEAVARNGGGRQASLLDAAVRRYVSIAGRARHGIDSGLMGRHASGASSFDRQRWQPRRPFAVRHNDRTLRRRGRSAVPM